MDLSSVRARRRRSLFRPWNSYLAKKSAAESIPLAREYDNRRARAHAGVAPHFSPVVRLTVKLIDTYNSINDAYYDRRAAATVSAGGVDGGTDGDDGGGGVSSHQSQYPFVNDYQHHPHQPPPHHQHHQDYDYKHSQHSSYPLNEQPHHLYQQQPHHSEFVPSSSQQHPYPHDYQFYHDNFHYQPQMDNEHVHVHHHPQQHQPYDCDSTFATHQHPHSHSLTYDPQNSAYPPPPPQFEHDFQHPHHSHHQSMQPQQHYHLPDHYQQFQPYNHNSSSNHSHLPTSSPGTGPASSSGTATKSTTVATSPQPNQYCDENSDYIVRTGEMFNNRYMLEKVIGRGTFAQVVRALDTRDNTHVAIKIIKNNSQYVEQALSEVRMTSYLNSIDPEDEHSIMRLRDKFIFRGHQCLVLELLSFSLYDLLRSTEFYGVSLNLVRKFCKQILRCLSFLARPDVNIAHCDLKPENVLLRHPQRSTIKVVDFGASCRISESMYLYVQSRFYRAPEVILGLPYSTQVDVWSLGCMLIELHTGYPLFAGKNQADQMAIIVERLGIPPSHMLERGRNTHLFFERNDDNIDDVDNNQNIGQNNNDNDTDNILNVNDSSSFPKSNNLSNSISLPTSPSSSRRRPTSPSTSSSSSWRLKQSVIDSHGRSPPGSNPIRAFVDHYTNSTNGRKRASGGHSEEDYDVFLSLALKMLQYDPDVRIDAKQALDDAFVRGAMTARSGRESPPPLHSGLGLLHPVHDGQRPSVDPGRKAPPLQRRRQHHHHHHHHQQKMTLSETTIQREKERQRQQAIQMREMDNGNVSLKLGKSNNNGTDDGSQMNQNNVTTTTTTDNSNNNNDTATNVTTETENFKMENSLNVPSSMTGRSSLSQEPEETISTTDIDNTPSSPTTTTIDEQTNANTFTMSDTNESKMKTLSNKFSKSVRIVTCDDVTVRNTNNRYKESCGSNSDHDVMNQEQDQRQPQRDDESLSMNNAAGGGGIDSGGRLRQSKSEPTLEPIVVPRRRFIFPRSDWAEGMGIEPPAWRTGGLLIDENTDYIPPPRCGAGGGRKLNETSFHPSIASLSSSLSSSLLHRSSSSTSLLQQQQRRFIQRKQMSGDNSGGGDVMQRWCFRHSKYRMWRHFEHPAAASMLHAGSAQGHHNNSKQLHLPRGHGDNLHLLKG